MNTSSNFDRGDQRHGVSPIVATLASAPNLS